ncbi:MAG: SCO family protein [Acidimicrobiia bacterium]|nr:SCO family protein [Acidimicrobiia bacterium]
MVMSRSRRGPRLGRSRLLVGVAAALVRVACGPDDGGDSTLTGIVRDPAPVVDGTVLPSVADEGEIVEFRARQGGLQAVYFGYTSCPDVCPTTLADLTVALRKLPDDQSAMVDTVMVTVDPDRDLDILADYVRSFIPDADAAGTDDDDLLAEAAEPFGVVYSVTALDDGSIGVEHSPFLYVVNDRGELVVTWQFGETSDNMAADMATLLERGGASA